MKDLFLFICLEDFVMYLVVMFVLFWVLVSEVLVNWELSSLHECL